MFNEPHYLEDLTGLTEMHQETIDAEVSSFGIIDTSVAISEVVVCPLCVHLISADKSYCSSRISAVI